MNIKKIFFLVLILGMVSLTFYVILYKQKINEPTLPNYDDELPTAVTDLSLKDWETYKDDKFNFSFEHQKDDFIIFGKKEEEPYLQIQNSDPNLNPALDSEVGVEYWVEIIIREKNQSNFTSCDKLIENHTESKLDGYKVYRNSSLVDEKDSVVKYSICFERPTYNLIINGVDFNHFGYNILDHIISSIKFTN